MARAMKLIRRCTLLFAMCSFTAYASAQMPVAPEAQPITVVPSEIDKIKIDTEVLNNFALESIPTETLASKISEVFRVQVTLAEKIVMAADRNAYSDFPSRNDILTFIAVESGYNPKASHKGSKGLMQVHEVAHKGKVGGQNLFDIEVNIFIGASILREYFLALSKNKKAAILANNAGIGNYLRKKFRIEYYKKFAKTYKIISNM